ncbi:NAD(P)/FAD-dependent oxidoreductase [Pseudomonas sp. NY15181]|uniref:NAD(P)/FAD-dependent oxidoreductase n=1 Tax=Pseudomonas sp. NY15181 TaxID=3400349 RepID=UPI003A84F24D
MSAVIDRQAVCGPVPQYPIAQAYEAGVVPIRFSGWPAAQPAPVYAALEGERDTDVVVVGAGLAGTSLTLHLAERGVRTVLLEADQPASGASGRNAGHVQPYLSSFEPLRAHRDEGRRFIETFTEQRNIVFELSRKHGLAADVEACGLLEVARRPQAALERQARLWKGMGYDVELVGGARVQEMLGTTLYIQGLHWREGGRVNPYLFTQGMAASAVRAGASVYGNSCVLACERDGSRWRVRTATGSVRAARVVLCTSGHAGNGFFPELARTQFPLVACGMATRPLPAAVLDAINPARVTLMQYPAGLYPLVIDGRGRLITATIPRHRQAQCAEVHFADFVRYLRRTYPGVGDAPIELESYWTGMTANSSSAYDAAYPKLYQVEQGVLALMNLGSWGNLMGPLLGMDLARALVADRPDDAILPLEQPQSVRLPGRFETKIRRVLIPAARLADRLDLV